MPVPFPPPVISPLSATGDCCAIAAGLTTPKLSVHKSIPWVVGCNGFTRSRGLHNAFFFIGQLPACEVAACFPRLTKTLVGAGWRVGEGLSANFFVRKLAKQCARPRGVRGRSARRRPARAEGSHPPCLPAPPSCPSAPARRTFSGEGRWVAAQGALRRRRGLARGARNAHTGEPALFYQAAGNAERRELFPVRKKSVDPGFEGSGRWRP